MNLTLFDTIVLLVALLALVVWLPVYRWRKNRKQGMAPRDEP